MENLFGNSEAGLRDVMTQYEAEELIRSLQKLDIDEYGSPV